VTYRMHSSHLNMACDCLAQYELVHILHKRAKPGFALFCGDGAHGSSAKDLTNKRDAGELLALEEIQDTARDTIMASYERSVDEVGGPRLINDEQDAKGEKVVLAETIDMGVALATLHHEKLAPTLVPDRIEHEWTLEVNNYPVSFAGKLDLQEKATEMPGILHDLKTVGATPSGDPIDKSIQMTLYSLWSRQYDGYSPPLALDYLVKLKTPKIKTFVGSKTAQDYEAFFNRVAAIYETISAGNFPPTNPNNYKCSRAYCGFFKNGCKHR